LTKDGNRLIWTANPESMNLFKTLLTFILLVLLVQCKHKKHSLSGEEPVEVSDFIEFFPATKLPYQLNDSALWKKEKDSLLIGHKVFAQFIPDSLINIGLGKGVKPRLYPVGKIKSPDDETYLIARTIAGDKRSAFVFVFDKKDRFLDGMPILQVDQDPSTHQTASIDKDFSLYKTVSRKNKDGSFSEGKDVYGLNKGNNKFMLIMTDAIGDQATELINPIDTFSHTNKYAADYGPGKTNLVSIRDGRKTDRLSFFIHFDKNSGACTGELKGEAILKSPNVAEYRLGGDPCVLRFTFSSAAVVVSELEGCGSHRGLRCSFDGTFARKKIAKPKPAKKKTK
jgi:hypothetical protein